MASNEYDLTRDIREKASDFNRQVDKQLAEGRALTSAGIVTLQEQVYALQEQLTILRFLVDFPDEESIQVEEAPLAEEKIAETQEEQPAADPIMKQVDEFEEAIAEDAELVEETDVDDAPELMDEREGPSVDETEPVKEVEEEEHSGVAQIAFEEEQPEATADEKDISEESSQQAESVEVNEANRKEDNSLAQKLEKQPIGDLTRSVGLNQRFLFSNELFNGNMEAFNRALNEINHLDSLDDAIRFIEVQLKEKYAWAEDSEAAEQFIGLVERRFV